MSENDSGLDCIITSVTVEEFPLICRICLSKNDLYPIFECAVGDMKAAHLLKQFAGLEINGHDSLPANICSTCLRELNRIYKFKKQCQNNDTLFRLLLQNLEVRIEELEPDANVAPNECFIKTEIHDVEDVSHTEKKDGSKLNDQGSSEEDDAETVRLKIEISEPKVYKCKDCPEEYLSRMELNNHRKQARHPWRRPLRSCDICGKILDSSHMAAHKRTHAKDRPHKCNVCAQAFGEAASLRKHVMAKHTGQRPFVCEHCGKGFIQSCRLRVHLKVHDRLKKLTGEQGDDEDDEDHKPDSSSQNLDKSKLHLQTHIKDADTQKFDTEAPNVSGPGKNSNRRHVCEICQKRYSSRDTLNQHRLVHGEKSYLCNDCGRTFHKKQSLETHLRLHNPENPHVCSVCEKVVGSARALTNHVLIHTGQKPHGCKFCKKSFRTLHILKRHMFVHGKKSYLCNNCGKTFYIKADLNSHMRLHNGTQKYACSICRRTFSSTTGLNYHMLVHSGQKPYGCEFCSKSFRTQTHLTEHIRMHTGERPYACEHCGKTFTRKVYLKRHHGDEHKDIDDSEIVVEQEEIDTSEKV